MVVDHPNCTVLLVSGDGDFANTLSRLKQRGFSIVLINAPSSNKQLGESLFDSLNSKSCL